MTSVDCSNRKRLLLELLHCYGSEENIAHDEKLKLDDLNIKSVQKAFKALESDFNSLLCHLRRKQNEELPIYKLPNEVLIEILLSLIPFADEFPLTFVHVSQVSHIFREIVTNIPKLWSNLSPIHFPLVDSFLSRSKDIPLNIRVGVDDPFESFIDTLRPLIYRWGSVNFTVFQSRMSYLLPCLYEPAPQLHTISIRAVGTQRLVHCPSSLFGFHTPNLRHLELVGIHLPFDSPLFRDLKTLVLCPGPECFFKPTPAEIANILISCPDLERLSLSLTLKEGTSSSSHDAFSDSPIQSVVVPLRSLRCFELRRVSPSTAHRILQMVELPESCLISCSVDTPDTYSQHRYADVVSILPSTFTSRDRLRGLDEILRLNISESSNDGSIKVEGWASHNKMALDLEFSYSTTRTPPWRPFLTSIGGPSLPLTRLRHLILRNVGEHPHLSETACIQILQRLSSLERLTISGRNLESLILAIAVPRTRSNSDSGRWICPNLKNLELVFPGRWTVQSLTMLVENRLDCDDVRTMESVELKGTIQVMREGDFGLEELAKKVQLIADPLRLVKSKEKGVECSGKRGRGESSTWIGDDWARDDYNW